MWLGGWDQHDCLTVFKAPTEVQGRNVSIRPKEANELDVRKLSAQLEAFYARSRIKALSGPVGQVLIKLSWQRVC